MYARPTILLVDDNPHIRSFIKPALEDSGFNCIEAANGEEAMYQVQESHPDLIVLDIELGDPDMNGIDVCNQLHSSGFNMPVIFLTVKATIEDLIIGLRVAGKGGDYVKKLEELLQIEAGELPKVQIARKSHDVHELIERIHLRLPEDIEQLGPHLRITRKQKKVEHLIAGHWEEVRLQPLEFEVFKTLVDARGNLVGTEELWDRVFQGGSTYFEESRESPVNDYRNNVRVCISKIRSKIDPNEVHGYIQTRHKFGYRFAAPD